MDKSRFQKTNELFANPPSFHPIPSHLYILPNGSPSFATNGHASCRYIPRYTKRPRVEEDYCTHYVYMYVRNDIRNPPPEFFLRSSPPYSFPPVLPSLLLSSVPSPVPFFLPWFLPPMLPHRASCRAVSKHLRGGTSTDLTSSPASQSKSTCLQCQSEYTFHCK